MRHFAPWLLFFAATILVRCDRSDPPGNKLANASSPYLREHADNPVHWVEWTEEALDRAAAEKKPVIVSIGYASCHWCHVMERETFMDTAVARIMNRDFICIKVDREERPDLDQVYIRAAEMLSGNAGWPLNAFAMADGRPFYAATYFPTEHWISLLGQVSKAYRDDFANVEKQAVAIQKNIASEDLQLFSANISDTSRIQSFLNTLPAWPASFDLEHGGLKGTNKFPMPAIAEFFLQHLHLTADAAYQNWVLTTLDEMADGGLYDHLGGGFSRYTVDSQWKVPHFEKMLYDNGQLVSLYAHAYQSTRNEFYKTTLDGTLNFISAELTAADGGFYSSINADSEGEEGKFYVWSIDEIRQVLGEEEANHFARLYGVTEKGNWEVGKNVLAVPNEYRHDLYTRLSLENARKKLLEVRNKRVRPTRDDKVLASWNAIMLNGYVDAFKATGETAYLTAATRNAEFLQSNLVTPHGKVFRSARLKGEPLPGFLEDYAWVAKGFINLYEVTFDMHWLASAKKIADHALKEFKHETAALFYYSPLDLRNPVARKVEVYDNVIPSSNSVFAEVLLLLGEYFQDSSYEHAALAAINTAAMEDPTTAIYLSNWARIAEIVSNRPYEVAIVGPNALAEARGLQRSYLPSSIFMGGPAENLPLLDNKLVEGKTVFYVCRNRVCKLPTEDRLQALKQLGYNQ